MWSTRVANKVTPRQNVNKERRVNMNDEVKPKLELISLFGVPVVKSNIGREFTKEELQFFNTDIPMHSDEYLEVQHTSQSNDYHIFDTFVEELKDIKTFCTQELKRYLEDIEGVNTDITNLNIIASWLNKLEPGGFRTVHTHRNSYLSGTFYINCLPNDNIQLIDRHFCNRPLALPKKKHTQFNTETALISIKKGDLLICPSVVPHQVGVNETEDIQRVSLSFDTWPTNLSSLYSPLATIEKSM